MATPKRPSRSRCRFNDAELPRELKPAEKVKLWIEQVDDFEPPLQDQTQSTRPATPIAQDAVPPTLVVESTTQHETRSVILSRSRYSQSIERAESAHDQDRDNKSVVTLSRSYVPSTPPRTPKQPSPGQGKNHRSRSKPKRRKPRNHAKTPTKQIRQEPVPDEESPLGAPRDIVPPPSSRGSQSPVYSQPPSPSVPSKYDIYRPTSPLARDSSSHMRSIIHLVADIRPPTPSIPPEVEYENIEADFEDELEVLREQEEQEERERMRQNAANPFKKPFQENVEDIDAELEEILIREQEKQEQGKIIFEERTDEEYQRLREQPLTLTQLSVPSSPPQPHGTFTSLFDIWTRALEAHHRITMTQDAKGKDKTPSRKAALVQPFVFPVSGDDLLSRLETLAAQGTQVSPIFPVKGPPCQMCNRPSKFGRVSAQNPNGNAHRPYYKCWACNHWTTWADLRGVAGQGENPPCECSLDAGGFGVGRLPSRMSVTGKRAISGPGKVFFTCAEGRCGFYEWG
ncbi:hypothetical protein V8F20_004749 [Naviculisporaceae sp. PSN 640]